MRKFGLYKGQKERCHFKIMILQYVHIIIRRIMGEYKLLTSYGYDYISNMEGYLTQIHNDIT